MDIIQQLTPDELLQTISVAAKDSVTPPPKLQVLLETAERMVKFQAEREFSNAMRLCQDEISPIAKTAENSHTGTNYAKLEAIDRAIRPYYTSHGFVMSFSSAPPRKEHSVRVTCDLRHSSGHTQQYELEGEIDTVGPKGNATKTGIQGLGSAVTHLKRYLTLMIWNLTLTDTPQFVSEEQASNITNMLNAAEVTGERMGKFLRFAQAGSVETIPRHRYFEVMKMLKRAEEHKRSGKNFTGRTDKIHPGGPSPA